MLLVRPRWHGLVLVGAGGRRPSPDESVPHWASQQAQHQQERPSKQQKYLGRSQGAVFFFFGGGDGGASITSCQTRATTGPARCARLCSDDFAYDAFQALHSHMRARAVCVHLLGHLAQRGLEC